MQIIKTKWCKIYILKKNNLKIQTIKLSHLLKPYKTTKGLCNSLVYGSTLGQPAHQKSSSSSLCEYAAILRKQNQVN